MKPNIIFYFSDQQRCDTLNDELMPNVWELGEEGIIFENSYTCQPVCGPARAIGSGWYKPNAVHYFDDFLYDLKNDPCEKNNLVNNKKYNDTLLQMRELLSLEMVNAGEKKPIFHKPFKTRKY